jgi:hypothetical protein
MSSAVMPSNVPRTCRLTSSKSTSSDRKPFDPANRSTRSSLLSSSSLTISAAEQLARFNAFGMSHIGSTARSTGTCRWR